ncbi:RIP metalloprotease RseP [candidate division KSB1 bacterium]|nr:MAG: RIP metalloprotease RseP [candidate division KSB1 bacterium]
MTTLIAFIFVLGVLIFLHEFGHFIFAKLTGIRVERFSLGFPPRAFGKKIGETDYCISYIPLGGYCKMAGMIDESLNSKGIEGKPWEFMSKPAYIKALVVSAGPLMNFLLAVLVFAASSFFVGERIINDKSIIGEVIKGSPAEKAGLMPGDRITAIGDKKIFKWEEMTGIVHNNPEKILNFSWIHNGKVVSKDIKTRRDTLIDADGKKVVVGIIGIYPRIDTIKVGFISSIGIGFKRTYQLTKLVAISIKKVVTGKESIKSFGGPIFIAKLAGESARSGIESLFVFMAFLSLNLGFLNLLPVPVLDGGHLVFIVLEAILRKPVPVKTKLVIHQIAMALIFLFIIIVTYNDIIR